MKTIEIYLNNKKTVYECKVGLVKKIDFQFVILGSNYTLKVREPTTSNFTIDWGDGTQTIVANNFSENISHNYPSNKEWTVTIKEYISGVIYFENDDKLVHVLTPLPNMSVADFSRHFFNCTSLVSLTEGLFNNNINAAIFLSCFEGCTSLVGEAPALWLRTNQGLSGTSCFYACTNLTNYTDIPLTWR